MGENKESNVYKLWPLFVKNRMVNSNKFWTKSNCPAHCVAMCTVSKKEVSMTDCYIGVKKTWAI